MKQRDAKARELHGRLVRQPFKDPSTGACQGALKPVKSCWNTVTTHT